MEHENTLKGVIDKFAEVFNKGLGCLQGVNVKLSVHDKAHPKFYKPRFVPLLLKEKVEKELEDLQEKGIISHVQSSSWAAPVVPV